MLLNMTPSELKRSRQRTNGEMKRIFTIIQDGSYCVFLYLSAFCKKKKISPFSEIPFFVMLSSTEVLMFTKGN